VGGSGFGWALNGLRIDDGNENGPPTIPSLSDGPGVPTFSPGVEDRKTLDHAQAECK
jgi:hypothetical protein